MFTWPSLRHLGKAYRKDCSLLSPKRAECLRMLSLPQWHCYYNWTSCMAYEHTRRMREIMANVCWAVLVEMILTPMHILRPSTQALCQACLIQITLYEVVAYGGCSLTLNNKGPIKGGTQAHAVLTCSYILDWSWRALHLLEHFVLVRILSALPPV